MTTSLSQIRFIVERDIEDTLDNDSVINWSNMAQTDFSLRVFVPGSTTQVITTTDLTYTLSPTTIREIRRLRLQSDIDNDINREYNPVYTFYNGVFEVPTPFTSADTLLIDYYKYLTYFTAITDLIDIQDRFFPLYTSYIEMKYYRLPSTLKKIGADEANLRYQDSFGVYNSTKKQVADAYNINIGIQKPAESGW